MDEIAKEVQRWCIQYELITMLKNQATAKDYFTEAEAAKALGISVARLHMLLDKNIFNDGSTRPEGLTLQSSDMVLLGFWNRCMPNPKVVRMPKRG
jgi:hypothetical protein